MTGKNPAPFDVTKVTEVKVPIQITPPNFRQAVFEIAGLDRLVVHRFSHKAKQAMLAKMEAGSQGRKGQKREKFDKVASFNEARYVSAEGWDGFNASAIRNAMISVCRLVNFKMTLAKMSIFAIADGLDATEPQMQLIRIYGPDWSDAKPTPQEDLVRTETGVAFVTVRPCYRPWQAKIGIRFDADQFSLQDVTNLLARVGLQAGLCEGRPDSPNSAGMGWGTFQIKTTEEVALGSGAVKS